MDKTGNILRSIFDTTNDVWFFVSPDYTIVFFNRKASENGLKFHGRELKAGDNILDYARDTQNNVDVGFQKSFQKALCGEQITENHEVKFPEPLPALWFRSKYIPVYEEDKLIGVSVTVSDISREKELEIGEIESAKKIRQLLNKGKNL